MIKKLFSPSGEISRRNFIINILLISLIGIIAILGVFFLQTPNSGNMDSSSVMLLLVIWPILMYVQIISIIKRFRNLGKPWRYLLLLRIPFYNVYLVIILMTQKSKAAATGIEIEGTKNEKSTPWYIRAIGGICLIVLLMYGFYQLIIQFMGNNPSYKLSESHIQESVIMKEMCGKITKTSMRGGSISTAGPTGEAEIQIGIDGETCEGSAYSSLTKSMGKWQIDEIIFDDGNKRINITE